MTDQLDCIVVGAGIIGLAVARRLALGGREVVVLEAEGDIATHTSSRNSEVVHAGIYYARDSLKARLCVAGRDRLYRYCEARGIAHRRTGKLIVASREDELPRLAALERSAAGNGVHDLRRLDRSEIEELEPAVRSVGGLLSPSTGIVDSHGLILALRADLEAAGGTIVCRSPVARVAVGSGGFEVVTGDAADYAVRCRTLVNAAGLRAPALAARIDGLPAGSVPASWFAKARYYAYQGRSPFRHLVYPLPEDGGLGIHATLDLDGAARFGPDVAWVDEVGYDFDDSARPDFVRAIERYFPALDADRLQPGYTGVRPKLSGPGQPAADFMIQGPTAHGVGGLVNLYGIESPGLTACLAIADEVHAALAAG